MPPEAFLMMLLIIGIPVLALFSIPLLAIWTHHRRQMAEIQLKRQSVLPADIRTEFDSLRQEIRALRDTTMQYDLSFDTTLQQIDRRVSQLERQSRTGLSQTASDNGPQQNLYNSVR